jgi:hypothetical protein
VAALAEMHVQGVSPRKVKVITEEPCGHAFAAAAVSAIVKRLDEELARFARRRLGEAFPDLILDARGACPPAATGRPGERVREAGVIRSQAVPIAIDPDGRRGVLAVAPANRESTTSWRDFLLGRKERGLPCRLCRHPSGGSAAADGVELVVSDDHAGLKAAIREVVPAAAPQRCGARARAGRAGPGGRPDLPERRQLSAPDPGAGRRGSRGLARGAPSPEHGGPDRAPERAARARRPSRAGRVELAGQPRRTPRTTRDTMAAQLAELDAHN